MRHTRLIPAFIAIIVLCIMFCFGASAAYTYPAMPANPEAITVEIGDSTYGTTTLPLSDYPDGAYWDPEKGSMSVSEARSYGISTNSEINLRGWQCVGFARYTFAACFYRYSQNVGMDTGLAYESRNSSAYYTVGTLPSGYSAAQVKALMLKAVPGSVMRIRGHSMVVMAIFSDGVLIYDANFSSANEVDVRSYTWASFAERLGSRGIEVLQAPAYYPGYTYYYYGIVFDSGNGNGGGIELDYSGAGQYVTANYTAYLNVRSGPGTSYGVVGTLPVNTVVDVIGFYQGWAAFYYDGVLCWVSTDYLRAYNSVLAVTFLPEGGYCDYTTRNYTVGQPFGNLPGAYKANRTFAGWYANGIRYTTDSIVPVATSLSLYAYWNIYEYCDVYEFDWYAGNIEKAVNNGLIVRDKIFRPNDASKRAEFVTVLGRACSNMNGTSVNYAAPSQFVDLEPGAYYGPYVGWAYENGIVYGTSETTFSPDHPVTRQQIAAMLYRYVQKYGLEAPYSGGNLLYRFSDGGLTDAYAVTPMNWAISIGLYLGDDQGRLNPQANATRAEMVTILNRFLERYDG